MMLLLAMAGLAACSCDTGGAAGVEGRVAVIGDSITVLTEEHVRNVADEFGFVVDAVRGATAEDMRSEVEGLAERRPSQVIINLGTNDVVQKREPDDTVDTIDDLIGDFDTAACIHLVTVSESMISSKDPDIASRSRAVNEGMRSLANDDDRVSLIDWSSLVRDYYDAGEPDGPLTTDTIHPTEVGQAKLARMYRDALNACPEAVPHPPETGQP